MQIKNPQTNVGGYYFYLLEQVQDPHPQSFFRVFEKTKSRTAPPNKTTEIIMFTIMVNITSLVFSVHHEFRLLFRSYVQK
jgi:hypothetical protein